MSQPTYHQLNERIYRTLDPPGWTWYVGLAFTISLIGVGFVAYLFQYFYGLGVTGLNNPVGWGPYIITFVFWVGIGHSGTLISAILFLFRARFRNAIYRSAEAMTVFAVMCAGIFPLIHLGRIYRFYWLLPYPNQRELWPNFKSPLILDVLAVTTYLTVSSMFFAVGLLPDIAAVRDRARGLRKKIYTVLALGWRGTDRQWRHYTAAYMFFAALATPLVVSVHSVVSWDFALSIVPGWHATLFAPYFVAGAIHSGLAMVITLLIPMRRILNLEEIITLRHFDRLAKMIVATGGIVGYSYGVEVFVAWYSGNIYEQAIFAWRPTGHYAPYFWIMVVCNVAVPALFLFPRIRQNLRWLFPLSILINVGMWFERYNIIVSSLAREYNPHSWGLYGSTHIGVSLVEFCIMLGSFGLFFTLFLIFVKVLPSVALAEEKEILPAPPSTRTEEAAS